MNSSSTSIASNIGPYLEKFWIQYPRRINCCYNFIIIFKLLKILQKKIYGKNKFNPLGLVYGVGLEP